jgi:hypothetical protein
MTREDKNTLVDALFTPSFYTPPPQLLSSPLQKDERRSFASHTHGLWHWALGATF